MKTPAFNTTVLFYPDKNPKLRLFALWYFTVLMIVWNILGHTVLGFEQSHAATVVCIGTAIFFQYFLEWVDATAKNREVRWAGSWANFLNALPAALIPGFACSMLLYPNARLWPFVFAVVLSIGSKVLLRAPVGGGRTQHVFNPSNFGVALTLGLFPDVGFAPPYHFTENVTGVWDWILPGFILLTGVIIHGFFTGRLPLVAAWIIGFALQGRDSRVPLRLPAHCADDADDQRGLHRLHTLHGARPGDDAAQAVAAGRLRFRRRDGLWHHPDAASGLWAVFCVAHGLRDPRNFAAPLFCIQVAPAVCGGLRRGHGGCVTRL